MDIPCIPCTHTPLPLFESWVIELSPWLPCLTIWDRHKSITIKPIWSKIWRSIVDLAKKQLLDQYFVYRDGVPWDIFLTLIPSSSLQWLTLYILYTVPRITFPSPNWMVSLPPPILVSKLLSLYEKTDLSPKSCAKQFMNLGCLLSLDCIITAYEIFYLPSAKLMLTRMNQKLVNWLARSLDRL